MQRNPEAKIIEVVTELTQEELDKVSAGKYDAFNGIGDIKGESVDQNHNDWVIGHIQHSH